MDVAGAPFEELCDHNAEVADFLCRPEVSIAWRNFKTFYGAFGAGPHVEMLPPELKVPS